MHLSLNNSLGKWILPAKAPFSPEATNYFSRLDAAGDTTYVDYKQPLANYIDSLVTLGGAYWDTMESSTSFVGVGIQGVTVPLRDGMTVPTQNNFVPGDLDQLTGLKGNGSTKDISTGVNNNDNAQNDLSVSTYLSDPQTTGLSVELGTGNVFSRLTLGRRDNAGPELFYSNQSGAVFVPVATEPSGFYGHSRSDGSGYAVYYNGSTTNKLAASQLPLASPITVFSGAGAFLSSARLATYHIGPALDLATLEGLQETLLSEIRTAHTFVAAASYFSRLAAAGDTTHVAYKQPLTNYITSLVELGGAYWDDMLSAASFVGVGIQGITVPLRDGMTVPTQSNFVADDLDQLTGLKGDASTKLINTGYIDSDLAQNDGSLSTYVTAPATVNNTYYAGTTTVGNTGTFLRDVSNSCQLNVHGGLIANGTDIISGLVGASRTDSTNVNARSNQTNYPFTDTSTTPTSDALQIFARSSANRSDARLATYHAGPALDLATLEGLQATLLAEIAGIGFSTEAANYFSRLANAGDTTFLAYRQPLANYIDSLVALGGAYWDDMKSAASFVGVGIQGVTVPLRDGMTVPTNNNFVAGDLNQLTGLKGDASTKYLDTGFNEGSLSQNDSSISVYLTTDRDVVTTSSYIGGTIGVFAIVDNATGFRSRHMSFSLKTNGTSTAVGGIIGISRDNSSDYDWRDVDASGTNIDTSTAQGNRAVEVFASSGGSFLCSARLATYHAGPALNLATLEALQDTLITEIAAI